MTEHDRLRQEILDYLFKIMQIDEKWTVRLPRGFTWWAHSLPQRVWVEHQMQITDHPVIRVQAETALLRNIPSSQKVQGAVDVLNKRASLNTYRWNPHTHLLRIRCSAYVTTETIGWLKSFLAEAIALQVADAHVKGRAEFAGLFGGEVDTSDHPKRGSREVRDDMLNVIENMFVPVGQKPSPFTAEDFAALERMEPSPSVLTSCNGHGATAEFAYYGPETTTFLKFFRKRPRVQTSLCEIAASLRHPQLGSGAFWKLTLPLELTEARAMETATELNLAEYTATPEPYFYNFGAWCSDSDRKAVSYVMFMPAVIHRPNILVSFLWSMRARNQWAKQFLSQSSETHGSA